MVAIPFGFQRKAEAQDDSVMSRVKALEAKLAESGDTTQNELEAALGQVRRMQGRVALMQPHTVIATIENLVEAAQRAHAKEAEYFKQALCEARRHQDSESFPELIIHLFGTHESKKVQAAIQAWSKQRKPDVKAAEKNAPAPEQGHAPSFYAPPPPYYPPPGYGYPQPWQHPEPTQGGYGRRGGYNARRGGRAQPRPVPGKCFYCGEQGHRVADCPELKDAKAKRRA